jgi:amino acid permease
LGDKVPELYRNIDNGFWAVIIMVVAVFPLSLFKEVSAIRYICAAGVLVSLYISIVITVEPFVGSIGQELHTNFNSLRWFEFEGILKTFPVTIFCFFCQTNS